MDPSTFRSLAPSAPPVIRASASTSRAAPIIIASRTAAPLQTPKEISAQSTSKPAVGAGGVKRRVSEMMELNGVAKKKKVEEELEEGEVGPNGEIGGAVVVAPPVAAPSGAPAPVVRKKKPASLFVPKKVRFWSRVCGAWELTWDWCCSVLRLVLQVVQRRSLSGLESLRPSVPSSPPSFVPQHLHPLRNQSHSRNHLEPIDSRNTTRFKCINTKLPQLYIFL